MELSESIINTIQNKIQVSIASEGEELDEVCCKRYWVRDRNSERRWLIWEFPEALAIVPEGGMIGKIGTEITLK